MARRVPVSYLLDDRSVVRDLNSPHFGKEKLSANSFLISGYGGLGVLVFTSMGNHYLSDDQMIYHGLATKDGSEPPNKIKELPDVLAEIGVKPERITHVIFTHLEYDHSGGILDTNGNPYLPHATHIARQGEFEYAKSDPFHTFYNMGLLSQLKRSLGNKLALIGNTENFFLAEGEGNMLALIATGGHTPYHQIVIGDYFIHPGDLMHDEHVISPARFNVYTRNIDDAVRAKHRILEDAVDHNKVVLFNHGHRHHAGRITKEETERGIKYKLIPVDLNQ
jgi:glyoxylase-like metal-dependent hydrolase (beta-lactamase superfamily II)